MATKAPRGRRPAGSPDARAQILDAAIVLFAENGFAQTTIRAVATRAGVDPALVYHYFGDKEGLLEEVIDFPVEPRSLFDSLAESAGAGSVGEALVLGVLSLYEEDPDALKRLIALLRTALSHEAAAGLLRDRVESALLALLAPLTASDQSERRAGLVMTQVLGLLLTRHVIRFPPIAKATREELAASMGPALDHYLKGPLA